MCYDGFNYAKIYYKYIGCQNKSLHIISKSQTNISTPFPHMLVLHHMVSHRPS